MEKQHGNANANEADHHLYEIYDQGRDDIYKYGICGDPLNPDGSSPRANIQVRDHNQAFGWKRFIAKILEICIPGRLEARRIEDEYIEAYRQKHGHRPAGNPKRGKKK